MWADRNSGSVPPQAEGKGGLAACCLPCVAYKAAQHKAADKLMKQNSPGSTWPCSACKEEVCILNFTPGLPKCHDCNKHAHRNRYQNDPAVAAICRLRTRHRGAFRAALGRGRESQSSLELLGVSSSQQLKAHMQAQFTAANGRTWANMDKWEVRTCLYTHSQIVMVTLQERFVRYLQRVKHPWVPGHPCGVISLHACPR